MLVEAGVLVLLIRRPPAALNRTWKHPLLAGAVAGAALSATLAVSTLPFSAIGHKRATDVGLSTQDWGPWLVDVARSTGIAAVVAGVGGALFVGLVRRFPKHWWAPGSVAVVAIGAIFLYASPLVLDPLFNTFTKLPPGQTRSDVLELARKSGVDVGEVYEVDASRRTTAANAYVTGLGHSKRVVLYDNLVKDFSRDETRLVVAHELGHVHYNDVPRGLIFLILVAPAGVFAVQRLTERLTPERGSAAMLPARGAERRRRRVRDHDDLQPALAPRRGARGQLLAQAHRRARAVHRHGEAALGPERVPARPARAGRPSSSAPTRRRSTGSGPGVAYERGERALAAVAGLLVAALELGQVLDPLAGRHLE